MTENEIAYKVKGAVFAVHNVLGPGLLESIYHKALLHELKKQGLAVRSEVAVPVIYDGELICDDLKIDILVEDSVILELKSVDKLQEVHKKQLQTYLKLSGKKLGLLINFNTVSIDRNSFIREVNGL